MTDAEKKYGPVKLAPQVDLPKFMGKWFVIAHLPLPGEGDSYAASETYTWNTEKEQIDIDYRHREGAFDGKEKKIPQKAWVHNKQTNSEWRVQLFWPLKFAYLISYVADDYSTTIVTTPNRKYAWIMARTPMIGTETYEALVAKLRGDGFNLEKLRKVPQRPEPQAQSPRKSPTHAKNIKSENSARL